MEIMNNDKNAIQYRFDSVFYDIRDKSIGIYGTGKNARAILENVEGYSFQCLIAQDYLYEKINGVLVLPLEKALDKISVIIIAAIPASASIVFNRIKNIVPNEIPIYDLQGYLLSRDDNYKKNKYWNASLSELKKQIDQHDVISFDLFDTLVTRTTLFPRDIFERMNIDAGFSIIRVEAEEELYKKFASPTLTQIYDWILSNKNWNTEKKAAVRKIELLTEKSVLVIRKEIYEMFKYAIDIGKKVYLTSDMYLEKKDIRWLLSSYGLNDGFKFLISCEYAKTKESGDLYNLIMEENRGKKIVHIGDNIISDIEKPKSKGLDTYYVKKGYDILAESSCAYLFDLLKTNNDKDILGYMISKVVNNPFCLSETKGKLYINSYEDIAICILPMTLLFLNRIIKWATEYDEILFASRDGFFLYVIYEWYRKTFKSMNLPEGKYIYVSRSAISSMAVKSDDDIDIFLNKIVDDPKLNLKKLVENQFHIEISEEFNLSNKEAVEKWNIEGIRTRIERYYDKIISNSSMLREKYLRYLKHTGIKTLGKIAIVDVVTQGTLVYGLSNIFDNDIDLFALGTSAVPNKYIKEISKVKSIYGNITERVGDSLYSMSDFSELHLFIEMLYASKEGQFYTIDNELKPIFVKSSEYNLNILENVQMSLRSMIEKIVVDKCFPEVSPEFALGMLRVFSKKYSVFSEEIKAKFAFEDQYDGSIQKCNLIDYIQ